MRSYLFLTESGPLLTLTSCPDTADERLLEALMQKGIEKFIAYEVPIEGLRSMYGAPFDAISADLERCRDLRVLDFNGRQIFANIKLGRLGSSVTYEH